VVNSFLYALCNTFNNTATHLWQHTALPVGALVVIYGLMFVLMQTVVAPRPYQVTISDKLTPNGQKIQQNLVC